VADDDIGWGRSLRIRVVIDLFKPLDRGRALELSGVSCWVPFKYEKLSSFCYRCGRIFHYPKGCPNKPIIKKSHNEGLPVWGTWLRAEESGHGGDGTHPKFSERPVEEVPKMASQAKDCPRKESWKAKGKNQRCRKIRKEDPCQSSMVQLVCPRKGKENLRMITFLENRRQGRREF
jgi:hypothetical protein